MGNLGCSEYNYSQARQYENASKFHRNISTDKTGIGGREEPKSGSMFDAAPETWDEKSHANSFQFPC